MKKWLMVLISLSSLSAMAAEKLGSKCGLTDFKEDGEWKLVKSVDLGRARDSKIQELPTLTKQQLIIAAKELAKRHAKEGLEINNTLGAVGNLRGNSEGGDLSVDYYKVKNLKITEVVHYPGGNPYGVFFIQGTRRIQAYDEDSTVYCKE